MGVRIHTRSADSGNKLPLLLGALVLIVLVCMYTQQREQGRMLQQLAVGVAAAATSTAAQATAQKVTAKVAVTAKPIPKLPFRTDLAQVLESEGLKTGAELGVLRGDFATHTLNIWKSCTTYYLVDLWAKQENYVDLANADNDEQERVYKRAQEQLQPFKEKTKFLRMYTSEAAKHIPDDSLDYVYIDARHDYCGVMEDLEAYWPKLRAGGIFAGHDYIDAHSEALKATQQDWSVCMNGTINWGAVKGAVDEFAANHGLTIVTTGEPDWPTWMARK